MWSDDERSTTYRTIKTDQNSTTNYVPVWKVLKQMYDEDKEALYCFSNNKNRDQYKEKDTESVASWEDYYYSSEDHDILSDDYYSGDDETYTSDADDSSSSTDESVDCNNKFIYI